MGKQFLNTLLALVFALSFSDIAFSLSGFPHYKVIDLGVLPGFETESYGTAINASGQVVGQSGCTECLHHAFLYDNGTMKDIGTLQGANEWSTARAISDNGQVVGNSSTCNTPGCGGGAHHAFLYKNGQMYDIWSYEDWNATQGLYDSYGINDSGYVVGMTSSETWENNSYIRAAITHNGSIITIPMYYAYAINGSGVIAGQLYYNADGVDQHKACVYSNGNVIKFENLTTDANEQSCARAINSSGHAAGDINCVVSGIGVTVGFIYKDGTMQDVGKITGRENDTWSVNPKGINSTDHIVGHVNLRGELTAFLYHDNSMVDLNTLIVGDNPFRSLFFANAINDNGYITGEGSLNAGPSHAFLAIPVPESSLIPILPLLLAN